MGRDQLKHGLGTEPPCSTRAGLNNDRVFSTKNLMGGQKTPGRRAGEKVSHLTKFQKKGKLGAFYHCQAPKGGIKTLFVI